MAFALIANHGLVVTAAVDQVSVWITDMASPSLINRYELSHERQEGLLLYQGV